MRLTARERLEADGIPTRVVSMPCQEWFDAQDSAYRTQVLPPVVKARVSVEAGVAMSWHDLVGESGECVSIEHYGASAPYQVLFEQFGFTADHVVAAARASLSRVGASQGFHHRQLNVREYDMSDRLGGAAPPRVSRSGSTTSPAATAVRPVGWTRCAASSTWSG